MVSSPEPLEHLFTILFPDAGAGIIHPDMGLPIGYRSRYLHAASARSVADRVIEEIAHEARDRARIAARQDPFPRRDSDRDIRRSRRLHQVLRRATDDRGHVDLAGFAVSLAGVRAREEEELVGDAGEPADFLQG